MLASPFAPGVLWVVAGVAAFGAAGGLGLALAVGEGAAWALLVAPMAGVLCFSAALVLGFALLPPGAAVPVTAVGGVAALALVLRWWKTHWGRPPLRANVAVAAVIAVAAMAAAGVWRMTYTVLLSTPFPPVLGEPSGGDMGLHASAASGTAGLDPFADKTLGKADVSGLIDHSLPIRELK